MNKNPKEPTQEEIDAVKRMMDLCYAKLGIAIAKVANESVLVDQAVLGCIQMVYGDMLVRMTGDPTMKQKWLEHCEKFQSRHFTH